MDGTIRQFLEAIPDEVQRNAVLAPILAMGSRMGTQATKSAGLEINTGGGYVPQIGSSSTYCGVVQGHPVTIAAGTDMPAFTTKITAGSYNVVCFFIDAASTVTAKAGIEGTTLAKVKFPNFPIDKALVGYIIIYYASAFTGGSTALDTATTVYVSPVGAFDPSINI